MSEVPRPRLAELLGILLRIGLTSFGAHMALLGAVQREVVERRRWLGSAEWSEIVALVASLPGPMAVNAVACLGHRLHGWRGALTAGMAILAPSALLMTLYALWYGGHADHPWARAALTLVPAAVAAIVLGAAAGMRQAVGSGRTGPAIAVAAAAACFLGGGRDVTWIVLAAACLGLATARRGARPVPGAAAERAGGGGAMLAAAVAAALVLAAAWLPASTPVLQLLLGFAHVSLFMFGGGYAAVPLFQQLAVEQQAWIGAQTLSDAIALSQLTPGPIMTSAGFIGQRVAGYPGNAAALAGMFLPMGSIAVLAWLGVRGLAAAWWMRGILAGVRPAAVGVIAGTGGLLAVAMPNPALAWPTLAASLLLLLRFRLPTYGLIPAVALLGIVVAALDGRLPLN